MEEYTSSLLIMAILTEGMFLIWCNLLVQKANIELRNDNIKRKLLLLINSHYTRENEASLSYLLENNMKRNKVR